MIEAKNSQQHGSRSNDDSSGEESDDFNDGLD